MKSMSTSLFKIIVTLTALIVGSCVPQKGGIRSTTLTAPFALDTSRILIVRNAGALINTSALEYAPTITPDGLTLYFVRSDLNTDIWSSTLLTPGDTLFNPPKRLPAPINSELNEGAITITADGRTALFTACNRDGGMGDCDIYELTTTAENKATMRNVEEINSEDWDSQPSISSDGKRLYFVSSRPGAMGGRGDIDIYMCERQNDGRWGRPNHLGWPVNTRQREDSPCLAMGDSVLFFSSSGHGGIGGMDLFASIRQANGEWGEPRNLGEVFNSSRDDRFISVTPDGATFYYSSERRDLPNAGYLDIFVVRTLSRAR